jgi:hypothetical protein
VAATTGPFAGLVGRLAELDDFGRAALLIEMLGRTGVRADLDAATLVPA